MSLGLYSKTDPNSLISSFNPFSVTFDGRTGGGQDHLIYIRNDATNRWYDSIKLQAVDTSSTGFVDNTKNGWLWKLKEKEIAPIYEEWALISPGNQLVLSVDIGNSTLADIVTYVPVWVHVEIPKGQDIQVITDIVLRLTAKEHAI